MARTVRMGGGRIDFTGKDTELQKTMESVINRSNKLEGQIKKLQDRAKKTSKGFTVMRAAIAAAIGAAVVGGAKRLIANFKDGATAALDYSTALVEAADNAAILPTRLEAIRGLLEQDGIGFSQTDKAILQFGRSIAEAKSGVASYAEAFTDVGLTLKEVVGLPLDQAFIKYAEAVASAEDHTIKLGSASIALGGAGAKMVGTFNKLRGVFGENVDMYDRLTKATDEAHISNKDLTGELEKLRVIDLDRQVTFAKNYREELLAIHKLWDSIVGAIVRATGAVIQFFQSSPTSNSIEELKRAISEQKRLIDINRQAAVAGSGPAQRVVERAQNALADLLRKLRRELEPLTKGVSIKVETPKATTEAAKAEPTLPNFSETTVETSKRLLALRNMSERQGQYDPFTERGYQTINRLLLLRNLSEKLGADRPAGILPFSEEREQRSVVESSDSIQAQLEKFKEPLTHIQQQWKAIGNSIKTDVVTSLSAAIQRTASWKDALRDLSNNILNKIIDQFLEIALFGGGADRKGGLLGPIFSAIGGFFQLGGPVGAGQPVLVGERGPELFIPSQSGMIEAHNRMMGGRPSVTNVFNMDSTEESKVRSVIEGYIPEIVRASCPGDRTGTWPSKPVARTRGVTDA